MADRTDRRRFLNTALLGTAGAGALLSREEKILGAAVEDGKAEAPEHPVYQGDPLPHGKIGKLAISRLIMGGNLVGGFAHSRDLLYVSRLLREYNTDAKIFETLALAEKSGVNTVQFNTGCYPYIEKYNKEHGGRMQAILCVDADFDDLAKVKDQIQEMVGRGVSALYTHGMFTDRCIMNGKFDTVAKIVEMIKAAGVPAGVGSHSLETTIASEKQGFNPDYYVKTFHPDTYWSASPPEARDEWCWYRDYSEDHDKYHDNIFCANPPRTIEVMRATGKPWIAFKVMAAGALTPQVGFQYAFANGADFIIAGMFDFQVADDVAIAVKALKRTQKRDRPWCA
ncbi:hypothetical protein [Paludisphaera mucosa]|uniref:Twin-arginine translocation signal domain-containing protein n=1 Tax=Paludisphaera mucosa TaxID=3030827 RepID=A0ABT6FBG8_9BACT|nr:hypothetical protein [Paludisphaera mucosa]MDG3004856.1 hypothetical protein [Paludisphaera mucosa]